MTKGETDGSVRAVWRITELGRQRIGVEPPPTVSYHDQIAQMLYEIGQLEGRVSQKEYRIDGERIDVAWKELKSGIPMPFLRFK